MINNRENDLILQRENQLVVLSRVNQKLNEKLEINVILRTLVEAALELTNAKEGTAGLFKNGQMVFREYYTQGQWTPVDYIFDPGYGVPGWVIENKEAYISNDTVNDPFVTKEIREQLGFYNLADTPILDRNGNLLGCFEIHNTENARPFDEGDIALLKSLSASAAVAMENALIIENLEMAQKKLKENQSSLRSLFEESPVSLWEEDCSAVKELLDEIRQQGTSDFDSYLKEHPEVVAQCAKLVRVTDVNKATVDLFEARNKESLLDNLDQLFTEESFDGFCKVLIFLATGKGKTQLSAINKTLSGRKIEVLVKFSVLPGYEESWERIVVSMVDVTREREIDKMKSEFISTAAHELNTPLTVLMGYTELILTDETGQLKPETQTEYLEEIYAKGLALERIIDDLLDVGKIETGRSLHIERSHVQISKLLSDVCKDHQHETKKHSVQVELPGQNICLFADSGKLAQVLDNLLGNAIKYSPDGGEIKVVGRIESDCLIVSISDPGIGMSEQQMNRAFEKFYRGDASDTAVPGLGLGMTIVKNIVEAHGGTIWIESAAKEGTKVTFKIPFFSTA